MSQAVPRNGTIRQGSASEVFTVFLMLGLSSFGEPTAHLGYCRAELVERRRWLDGVENSWSEMPPARQSGWNSGVHRERQL